VDVFLGEWLNLLIRWAHMVVSIGWIGTSFYFMALDYSLSKRERMNPGVLGTAWFDRRQREEARAKLDRFLAWQAANPRTLIGAELTFDVPVGRARLRGSVDRLERDDEGRLVVVDLKTGSKDAEGVEEHGQLAAYQVAIASGAFPEHGTVPGGAALVQVGPSRTRAGSSSWVSRFVGIPVRPSIRSRCSSASDWCRPSALRASCSCLAGTGRSRSSWCSSDTSSCSSRSCRSVRRSSIAISCPR
jgi:hypothetical protein